MRLAVVAVLGTIACSSASPAAEEAPAAAPAPAAPAAPSVKERADAEALGPREGAPCDFENDGVPLIGDMSLTEEGPQFELLDAGREPRNVLRRGRPGRVASPWLLTVDTSIDMGVEQMGVMHLQDKLRFTIDMPDPTASRLRYTVIAAEAADPRFERSNVSDADKDSTRETVVGDARKQVGDFFEVLLDEDGQPYDVDPTGDREPVFFGKMAGTVMALPPEPVGVGARWVIRKTRGVLATTTTVRFVERHGELAQLQATILLRMGPFRQLFEGRRQHLWTVDELRDTWMIDPGTPVSAFHGERETYSFLAECRNGRIHLHRMVTRSTARFETTAPVAPGR
jgi:hypothetical protein